MNRVPRKGSRPKGRRRLSDVAAKSARERRPTVDELRRIGLFGGLDDDVLAELCDRLPIDSVDAGSLVFDEGERGRAIYVVLEGELRVTKRGISLGTVGPGAWVGAMSVIDVMPRYARVEAVSPALLLRLRARDLDTLYRRDAKAYALLVMNIARELSRELRAASELLLERYE